VCGGCAPRIAALAGSDQWRPVRCEALAYPAKNVIEVTLAPFEGERDPLPSFQPGQHVVVQGLLGEDWVERPYTLASSAHHPEQYTVLIKQEPQGVFSSWARRQLEVGDVLRISPPAGEACLPAEDPERPVAAIVAGIGVTPALALAETLAAQAPQRPLSIFYCARDRAQFLALPRLQALKAAGLNLSLTLWETGAQGRPKEQDLTAFLAAAASPFVFVCGPEGFDAVVTPALDAAAVPEARRFLEVFTPQGARPERTLGPACPIPDGFKFQWPGSEGAPDQGPCPDAAQPRAGLVTVQDSLAVQAEAFLHQCYEELGAPEAFADRWAVVASAIEATGTYVHTYDELLFGARLAWRNSARCVGRLFWNGLHLEDARDVTDTDGMFDALKRHMALATQGGQLRAVMTAFRPQQPGEVRGPRVWNSQLCRYAGYRQPDGALLGDPANERMTEEALRRGWTPPSPRSAFDILPLILEMPGAEPALYEIPPELVLEVPLSHPELPWFQTLGLKWYALPAVSEVKLSLGGLSYTAAPFNGWYMGTEIGARNLSDPYRYNLLPEIARRMGLPTHRPRSLWQDRALLELNVAVLHSFEQAGVKLVDHHAATADFMQFAEQEQAAGRLVAGRWSWLVPPMSGSATPTFHYEWEEHTVLPQYFYQAEPWHR
jgi:nitric-oxide synthase